MNTILWIAQGLGAALFLMVGFNKAFTPWDKLIVKMPGMKDSPVAFVRFLGIVEILGGLGLVLPQALTILPILTPIAAVGLAIIMFLAIFVHLPKKEYKAVGMNIAFLGLMVFVAVGRFII